MSVDSLHLDGIASYTYGVLYGYDWEVTKDGMQKLLLGNSFKAEVLARIFSVANAAILTVTSTLKLTIRGSVTLVSGMITCNCQHIRFGLTDIISVPVQAVTLPILGIIGTFSPKFAGELGDSFIRLTNAQIKKSFPWKEHQKPENTQIEPIVFLHQTLEMKNPISQVLLSLTAPMQSVLFFTEGFTRALLSADVGAFTCLAPCSLLWSPFVAACVFSPQKSGDVSALTVHGLQQI